MRKNHKKPWDVDLAASKLYLITVAVSLGLYVLLMLALAATGYVVTMFGRTAFTWPEYFRCVKTIGAVLVAVLVAPMLACSAIYYAKYRRKRRPGPDSEGKAGE